MLRMGYYTFRRMIRGYLGLVLLVVVPMLLISVISLVSAYMHTATYNGVTLRGMDYAAVSFVLAFQLFGASYTMNFFQDDLLGERKWRLHSLPLNVQAYGISIVATSTLFNALQGLALILFTHWVFDVHWGSFGWALVVLATLAFFSQIVGLILILTLKSLKAAERASEVIGIGSMVLAGLVFPLPQGAPFEFLSTYGNPVSLGATAIFGMAYGSGAQAWISFGGLLAVSAALALWAAPLGRRKLA